MRPACWRSAGRSWQQQYSRLASDLPGRERNLAEEPIQEVELWDLVSAFGRIMRDSVAAKPSNIVYDDTPIHVYMEPDPRPAACSAGSWPSASCFDAGMHKSAMIGIFLAVLELVRHHRVRVEQNEVFGEIWLLPEADCSQPLDLSNVDNYEHAKS